MVGKWSETVREMSGTCLEKGQKFLLKAGGPRGRECSEIDLYFAFIVSCLLRKIGRLHILIPIPEKSYDFHSFCSETKIGLSLPPLRRPRACPPSLY
jgi:hypothetical protein